MRERFYLFIYLFIYLFVNTSTVNQDPIESKGAKIHDDEDLTGRVIAENYRILSKLGAGSFGQVYLCENIHTNEQWAIKIELINKNTRPILASEVDRSIDLI